MQEPRNPKAGIYGHRRTTPPQSSLGHPFALLLRATILLVDSHGRFLLPVIPHARGGGRTRTTIAGLGILSPVRLPISPPGPIEVINCSDSG